MRCGGWRATTPGRLLRPTKGVHVLAPGRGLTAAFLLLHPDDGRVFFVIPWLGKTLIGTTDTVCDEPPDAVSVTPADVDYLLRGHNHYFQPSLSPNDLLGSFVGAAAAGAGAAGRAVGAVARVRRVGVAVGAAHRLRRQVHHLPPHGRGRRGQGGAAAGPAPPLPHARFPAGRGAA